MVGGHATVGRLSNNVFERFKRFGKILKKVAEWSRDSGWGHATVGRLSNNVFWRFQAIWENFEKSRWTVTRQWLGSRDRRPTVKQRFLDVSSDLGKFWKKSLNGHATVVEVTRPSADCQTTFSGRFKRFGKILKKVAERSRDSGWGHASVGRLSNNVFWTFQAIRKFFWKKSLKGHATVVEVTRPLADCQTTFFGRFKRFGKFLKKVAEWSRDSGWGHATVGRLSNNVFWTFQAIWENFEKSRWTVTRQWLRSRDRRPTVKQRFLDVSSDLGEFWKKSLNGHATVVEVTRPSADCQTTFLDVSSDLGEFWKKSLNGHATVIEVTRPLADCQTTFVGRWKRFGKILKKVAEWSRDSGWGHATVGRLSNNVFWTFQAIWEKFWKKSLNGHATVVGVTRSSADCQTTFFGRFKQLGKFLKKVTERSRDSGRRSRDRRPTVKQRFLDVSSDFRKFWKKSLNGHATVVGGHATVGRLSNNVPGRLKRFVKILKKSLNGHATVVGGHATVDRLSNNDFSTFQAIRIFFEKSR